MASVFNVPTSSDATTWAEGMLTGAQDEPDVIQDLVAGPTGFLGAGREHRTQARALFSSLDGATWTLVFKDAADTGAFNWIGHVGTRWFLGGIDDNAMYTSTDGTRWTRVGEALTDGSNGYAAWATNGSRWLAWSFRDEEVVLSDDATHWRKRQSGGDLGSSVGALMWDGQAFVIPGSGISNSGVVWFSADGERWDVQNGVSTKSFLHGTSDGPRLVLVGKGGTIYTAEKR